MPFPQDAPPQVDNSGAGPVVAPAQEDQSAAAPPPMAPPSGPEEAQQQAEGFDFNAVLGQAEQELAADQPGSLGAQADKMLGPAGNAVVKTLIPGGAPVAEAVAAGVGKAVFETKDAIGELLGAVSGGRLGWDEPKWDDKSSVRRFVESEAGKLKRESSLNGIVTSLASFGTAFVGIGKFTSGLRGATRLGAYAYEAGRGALAGAVSQDPHEERLSNAFNNMVDSYAPILKNPVTKYLASDPNDGAAEGRLKAAIEGLFLDVGATAAFMGAAKVVKLIKSGAKGPEVAQGLDKIEEDLHKIKFRPNAEDSAEANAKAAAMAQEPEAGELGSRAAMRGEEPPLAANNRPPVKGKLPQQEQQQAPDNFDQAERDAIQQGDPPAKPQQGGTPAGDLFDDTSKSLEDTFDASPAMPARSRGDDTISGDGGAPSDLGGASRVEPKAAPGAEAPAITTERAPLRITVTKRPALLDPERANTPDAVEVPKVIDRMRRDNAAIDRHGGFEEAIDAGHRFRQPEEGFIPWQRINTGDETRAFVANTVEHNRDYFNDIKGGVDGVLSDKRVNDTVRQMAEAYNEAPATILLQIQRAGKAANTMVAEMETAFLLSQKMYQDAYALARQIAAENATGFVSLQAAKEELAKRIAIANTTMAEAKAIRAAGGRVVRRNRSEFAATEAQLANLKGSNPDELVNLMLDTGGNSAALVQAGTVAGGRKIVDRVTGLYAASLLWGWKTQVVNFATSFSQLVWRPLEQGLGAKVLQGVNAIGGNSVRAAEAASLARRNLYETTYLHSTLMDGYQTAKTAFLRGDSVLAPHATEVTNAMGGVGPIVFRPHNTLEDVVANALNAANYGATGSMRLMGATDEMVKQMRYRSVVQAKAAVEGGEQGLKGKQLRDFVEERLKNSLDDQGRAIDTDALDEALKTTWQNDIVADKDTWFGGSVGSGIAALTRAYPAFKFAIPFVRTPTNLIRHGIKLTPGLNLLQKEYTTALLGSQGLEAQARATGQMALGTLIGGIGFSLWANGTLTASGPIDPKEKREWLAQGNRPWSVTWLDDQGKRQFVELSRFDPLITPMFLVADAAQMIASGSLKQQDAEAIKGAVLLSFAHLLKDKTMLRNIDQVVTWMGKPDKGTFTNSLVPAILPFSSAIKDVRNYEDPILRETRGFVDSFKNYIPGLSQTLPARIDFKGEKVPVPSGFTSERDEGPLNKFLDSMYFETGTMFQPIPPVKENVDLRDLKLDNGQNAYERLQELSGKPGAGASMREALEKLVSSEAFQKLPHGRTSDKGTQEYAAADIISKYREGAWKQLKGTDKALQAALRERPDQIAKARAARKDPKIAAGEVATDRINRVLAPFGLGTP